ncbi:Hypothetical_protein [Hexamita inflata]|uniref:Hypothetical_protein n=1 Tax=Hexamita inflata TaxID=28002 RepID=A0AA86TFR2_9EUKA|nr:Hypothetical protein HINF_LOCUS2627 [Hexamita inflata]
MLKILLQFVLSPIIFVLMCSTILPLQNNTYCVYKFTLSFLFVLAHLVHKKTQSKYQLIALIFYGLGDVIITRFLVPAGVVFAIGHIIFIQLWEVELLFLVYYVSNYILKYFATSNADDKFQQIISSWRLFMNYSLTQEGQKYDFDRIRPQSTIQSRYLIFQKGKIEITTCIKRTAMTKINAVEDVQGRSTNSLNKLRQF